MKKILLTQGQIALVDDCDFEWLNQWKWCASKSYCTFYAIRSDRYPETKKAHTVLMRRLILNAPKGMDVDHRDHFGLNNQRGNLRLCTHRQNIHNSRANRNSKTSVYKGVSYCKERKKWRACTEFQGKTIHLGRFSEQIEAAKCYDAKARELFGEFACTNF